MVGLFSQYEEEQITLILQGLYAVWKAGNNACFNNIIDDQVTTMMMAINALKDWCNAQEIKEIISNREQRCT